MIRTALACLAATLLAASAAAVWPNSPSQAIEIGDLLEDVHSAPDGLGGILITWKEDRGFGSGNDIYAQRVDRDGNVMWGPDGVIVSDYDGEQRTPQICSDGAGGAIVAYADKHGLPGIQTYEIWAQRISAAGQWLWGSNGVRVSNAGLAVRSDSRIVPDGLGGAIVAWNDFSLFAQRLLPDGNAAWSAGGEDVNVGSEVKVWNLTSDEQGGGWFIYSNVLNNSAYTHHIDANGDYLWGLGSGYLIDPNPVSATLDIRPDARPDGNGGALYALVWKNPGDDAGTATYTRFELDGTERSGGRFWFPTHVPSTQAQVARDPYGNIAFALREGSHTRVDYIDNVGEGQWTMQLPIRPEANEPDAPRWSLHIDAAGHPRVTGVTEDGLNFASLQSLHRVDKSDGSLPWGAFGSVYTDLGASTLRTMRAYDDGRGGSVLCSSYELGSTIVARVDPHGYLGDPSPVVNSVVDVPVDQGGNVLASWSPSYLDSPFWNEIDRYSVWRRDATGLSKHVELDPAALLLPMPHAKTQKLASAGWEYVGEQAAYMLPAYSYSVPTYFDANAQSADIEVMVLAHHEDPTMWWQADAALGASLDNLAPGAPSGFVNHVNYLGGNVLQWNPATEPDFEHFRIYRGTDPGFVADPSSLVASTTQENWIDPAASGEGFYYKLSIVDDAGLEGPAVDPQQITSAPGEEIAGPRFALYGATPNPFNPATTIRFEVPRAGTVRLIVHDVAGRLVRTLVDGELDAGDHTVRWNGRDDRGRSVASGVYFATLDGAGVTQRKKLSLIK